MKVYNTLTRSLEELKPHEKNLVRVYSCGPTVYWRMQIGNLRSYVNWDILHRALLYQDYKLARVMNFTDVGHMTEDEDFGEDKLEKTAQSEGKTPEEVANFYIRTVLEDFAAMNILHPSGEEIDPDMEIDQTREHGWVRATEYVEDMIEHIKRVEKNGYTYETEHALYFDVTKLPEYTELSGQSLSEKLVGVRDEVEVDPDKKNPADFVLWMKRVGKYKKHIQHWDSPWGDGFPGWHIECSAMGIRKLGEYIDIHTGGVDHIAVHHTNERAQNIGAYLHPVVKVWMHNEFLVSKDGDKLSKSKGNALTLPDVIELGYNPLDLRFYFALINYRQPIYFSQEGLDGAANARKSLNDRVAAIALDAGSDDGEVLDEWKKRFVEALEDDLNMSQAYAVLSELLKSDENKADILATILDFDRVFAFDLATVAKGELESDELPEDVAQLLEARAKARDGKEWDRSDSLRDQLRDLGYEVIDSQDGQKVRKL